MMFNHALESRVMYGVRLRNLGKMCHLQYINILVILIARGIEDLISIKLILYLFKGMLRLAINFDKTSIVSTIPSHLPEKPFAHILNCTKAQLPVMCLGVPP